MTTQPREIGSISTSLETRSRLAQSSRTWVCRECGLDHSKLLKLTSDLIPTDSSLEGVNRALFVEHDLNRELEQKLMTRKLKKAFRAVHDKRREEMKWKRFGRVLVCALFFLVFTFFRFVFLSDVHGFTMS